VSALGFSVEFRTQFTAEEGRLRERGAAGRERRAGVDIPLELYLYTMFGCWDLFVCWDLPSLHAKRSIFWYGSHCLSEQSRDRFWDMKPLVEPNPRVLPLQEYTPCSTPTGVHPWLYTCWIRDTFCSTPTGSVLSATAYLYGTCVASVTAYPLRV
jgi:hypothetical protein